MCIRDRDRAGHVYAFFVSEDAAGDIRALMVGGFAEPIAKELPLEDAVEMNNLIHVEMKGSIG